MGPTPWLDGQPPSALVEGQASSSLYRRQAATLAIALLAETDGGVDADGYLRECVRTSLIRWQLSLRGDGRPAHQRLQRCPLQGAVAGLTAQLLTETSGCQTEMLLDDMASHMMWLARGRPRTPWLEATIICAMADAAVVIRDLSLHSAARRRVSDLLARQDREGWFPERGGADVGRLSLTVDALARLYRQNGWEELLEPLTRACRLILHFVHPDGRVGGGYSSCATAFLSPYGVELLAPTMAEAASLAQVTRKRCDRILSEGITGWHDDLLAIMGPRIALAAAVAPPDLSPKADLPCWSNGHTHFPNAGLAIYATDAYHAVVGGGKGGAMHVTWRNGAPVLDEPGVTVVFPRKTRCAGRWDRRAYSEITPASTTSHGILQMPIGAPRRGWRRLASILRFFGSSAVAQDGISSRSGEAPGPADRRQLVHDRYRRDIAFGQDTIRIRDVVQCRLPCQAIICQSPPTALAVRFVDVDNLAVSRRPPLFVEGGKKVEILRVYRQGVLVEQRVVRS